MVNLGAGIICTMTGLVFGLLVASAKADYDTQSNELTAVAAKIILLDRGLAFYSSETKEALDLLRRSVNGMVVQLWPSEQHSQPIWRTQPNTAAEL